MQCASLPAIGFPISSTSSTATGNNTKPFVLKSKQIKVCQSCRKTMKEQNDTLGMVVARAERRLIINQGCNFWERKVTHITMHAYPVLKTPVHPLKVKIWS